MDIIFSPHPDDAIFSCGGRLLKTNRDLLVVNIFAKKYKGRTKWDQLCETTENPIEERIAEDKKILSKLGIDSIYLNFYDNAVYKDIKKSLRPEREKEEIRKEINKIVSKHSQSRLFFPLGIDHSDHKLLSEIGRKIKGEKIFYQDLPYGFGKSCGRWKKFLITNQFKKKLDLILSYKTQINGFLKLTETSSIKSFKKKLINHHKKGDDYYEFFKN